MVIAIGCKLDARLVTVRTHNVILKTLNLDTMHFVKDFFWPKHFQNVPETYPGAGGYGYQRRSKKYEARKFRKFGHNRPLVYTGDLERATKNAARVSGTSRGAVLRARHPHAMQKERFKELNAVSNREQQQLALRYGREYIRMTRFPEYQESRLKKPVSV